MADLSKIKLNGTNYNLKDMVAREAIAAMGGGAISDLPVATTTSNGLMSAADKAVLDNLNPNVSVTISNWNNSDLEIINAKQENLIDISINEEPHILVQVRTTNLLDINGNITTGYYIGSNGAPATNANDIMGDFIPVTPGQDIYYTGHIGPTNSSSINRRLHVYNSNKTWIKQMSFAGSLHVGDDWSTHGIVPNNGAYIRVSWGTADTNVMLSIGAPTKYEPYYLTPFEAITSASFQIAPNSDMTNATTYTVAVPAIAGDLYGFRMDPIQGKIYATAGHISSYNGETLPGIWWSDRDIYEEGNTPTTGAEVVYILDDNNIIEYNITPLTIPLFYHLNHIHVDNGEILNFVYYAETFAVDHITIGNGVTFGHNDIFESTVDSWNYAATEIDSKAPLDAPAFTGAPTAPTPGPNTNSDRIATTSFIQRAFNGTIATNELSGKASKNYAIGEYLITGGILYKVTAAISSGTTITAGTNVSATTVADELNLFFSLI